VNVRRWKTMIGGIIMSRLLRELSMAWNSDDGVESEDISTSLGVERRCKWGCSFERSDEVVIVA
jgi:hypothetical protein